MSERTGIQMYVAGTFVESDPAVPQFEGGLAKLCRRNPRDQEIDCLSLHVQAVLGDMSVRPNQHGIVLRRPKTGNHVDLFLTAEFLLHQIDMLQHTHVDSSDFARVMATQEVIHIIERHKVIVPVFVSVGDIQSLICPDAQQRQPAFWKFTSLRPLWTNEPSTQQQSPH